MRARNLGDVVVATAVVVALVVGLGLSERRRAQEAQEQYGMVVAAASSHLDGWLADHVAFQRSVAFLEPDADALEAALSPTYVSFALLLDGDGRVRTTFPSRPDIAAGDDLRGRFPHIDAVLDGAEAAYWASGAATTTSGAVGAVAVAGPGQPSSVLTVAFDLVDTPVPGLLGDSLAVVDGASWSVTDLRTGTDLLAAPGTATDNLRSSTTAGWRLDVTAPDASIEALVGGVADWPGRIVAATLIVGLVVAVVWRRRRHAASAGLGLDGDLRVFEASHIATFLVDAETGCIVRVNAALCGLTGRTERNLVGAPLSDVIVGGDEAGAAPTVAVAAAGAVLECSYWCDGEQRSGRVARRPLPARGASAAHLVLFELVDLDVEHRRNAALERQQAALQELAGRLSHDLRTPLSAMVGFADLLERMPDATPDNRALWASRISVNARQLNDYVLDMAEATIDLARRPGTAVRGCVERAIRLHQASILAAGAHVDNQVPDDATVAMPELLLRQVVANLLDNAVKYRNRAVPLHVVVDARTDDGDVEITVADNGPGVPATLRERIFDDGARSSRDRIAGTGLGLAMCRDLAADADGTLVVRDHQPIGACFVLRLPAARGVAAHPEIDPSRIPGALGAEAPATASAGDGPVGPTDDGPVAPAEDGIDRDTLDRYRAEEVAIRHPSGHVAYLSPADGRLAGMLAADGGSQGQRIHPDDVAAVITALQAAAADPGSRHDVRARFRDLDDRWMGTLLSFVQPPPEDDLGGVVVSARALPEASESGTIFEDLAVPALLLGHHRQLLQANGPAVERFGWDAEALPVHDWLDDLDADTVPHVRAALGERTTSTWTSEDGTRTGLVTRLTGDVEADAFLVLLAETEAGRARIDARYDALTGLPDPGTARGHLLRSLGRADRGATVVTVVEVVDLPGVNERHGHDGGDAVLQVLADRLRIIAPEVDAVTRRGAGEFVAVIGAARGDDAADGDDRAARRLIARLEAHLRSPIPLPGGGSASPPLVIGSAIVPADADPDPDLALIAAEQARADARNGAGSHVVTVG